MTSTSTPAPIVTTDARAHRHASCRRARSFPDTTDVQSITDLAAAPVTACTYCKPSPALVKQAVSELRQVAATLAPADDEDARAVSDCPRCGLGEHPAYGDDVEPGPVCSACEGELAEQEVDDDGQAEPVLPTLTVTPEAQARLEQVADDLAAARAEAVPTAADLMRADRARGLTHVEIAAAYGVSATEVRTVLGSQGRGQQRDGAPAPAKAAKAPRAPRKAAKAPADPAAPAARRAPRGGLPEVTQADLDGLVALRQTGASYRALEAAFPQLRRSSSPLRKLVLAEAARRGIALA